jgi:flagellar basal body rod protein FlgG
LQLDTVAGAVAGTPIAPGTFNFTIQVVDSAGSPVTDTQPYTVTIDQAAASFTVKTDGNYRVTGNGRIN